MRVIYFYSEEINFIPQHKTNLRKWIQNAIEDKQKKALRINYIFTTDAFLININKKFLNHNTYTDIITFDQSLNKDLIEADIFISVERVKENSRKFKIPFKDELHRVMIHGVLHLIGYNDKTETQKKEMRKIENHYLALRFLNNN